MKISYRILLINFVIVVIIVGSSAFAFYSIMYNLLNSQQSKYLLNSANDFVYFYNEYLQETEYDFLYLVKDDVHPNIDAEMLKDRNIDFILQVVNDSTKMLASVSFVEPVDIKSQLFTLDEFNRDNPYAIIKGYRHLDGTYYYFGRILNQAELTGLAKKIGAEIAFIWQTTPVVVSNESINNIYTYDIKSAFNHLSQRHNFALYSQGTEHNDLLATIFKPTEYPPTSVNFEFIIFTVLKEATELRTNLKYLLILIGFSGVVLSLILTYLFTDRFRRQITQLSNATENIRHGNFTNKISVKSNDELGHLAKAFNIMVEELDKNQKSKQEYSEFITLINKNPTLQEISDEALKKIIKTCKFTVGAIFMVDGEDAKIISTHGLKATSSSQEELELLKPIIKNKEPMEITSAEDLPVVSNGLLSFNLKYLLIQPILYNNKVVAVLELGGVENPSTESKEYLNKILEQLAIGLTNAVAFVQLENFVSELKNLNDEFQKQNDHIRKQNETLVELHQKLKEKAGELEAQKQRAEEATKLKSQFLASMSHELRTPMNSILGLTELVLEQGGVTGKDYERISVVLKSGHRLMNLINDILDLSKIEAGKMELREEDVLIEEIIMEAETSISPLVINKAINFRVIYNAEPKLIIRTDRGKVIQVLINLMANAIKFTDKGNVVLNISQPKTTELQFEVIDTGVGISAEHQKVIFEEFRQVDGTSTKKYGGTGLGLAICKKIANLLNGSLEVESVPGSGSTFIFKIPLVKIGVKAAPIIEKEEKTGTVTEQPVLIVEEDNEIRFMMEQYLSSLGYETVFYNPEADIVYTVKKKNPIAIVVDLNMKKKDVWSIIKSVKDNSETSNIQLILVNIKNDENKGYGVDVFDYYIKPAGNNLISTIKRLSASIGKPIKNIVIIEDDLSENDTLTSLLASDDAAIQFINTGKPVITQLL
ncbi:MAG: HAMP domain-containing protein, partial [Ignavibacteriaceae bacterium]|nr:HAMP domain-containing protein [Ignavibacteriaceae bacterium]